MVAILKMTANKQITAFCMTSIYMLVEESKQLANQLGSRQSKYCGAVITVMK